jgi:hypothetical protein
MMRTRHQLTLLVAIVLLAACSPSPTEADYEFGRADVYVRDTESQPVNGVQVRLLRTSGAVEDAGGMTGTAGLPGYFFFLRTSGEFRIEITPPSGYELASGEASIPFTFARNVTREVTFTLRRLPS